MSYYFFEEHHNMNFETVINLKLHKSRLTADIVKKDGTKYFKFTVSVKTTV